MKLGSPTAKLIILLLMGATFYTVYSLDPTIHLQKTFNNLLTVGYLSSKYIGYTLWCFFGSRWIFVRSDRSAMAWGAIRLVIGIVFGATIAAALKSIGLMSVFSFGSFLLWAYIGILIPVRWIEWYILELMISEGKPRPGFILVGSGSFKWRVGGIIVSFLADAPMWFATVIALGVC